MDGKTHESLPKSFTAMVRADGRDIAVPNGQVYITHEQAERLYGDPKDEVGSLDPKSMVGALFDLKNALMEIVVKRGGDKLESPLNGDFTELARLNESLTALLSHAKKGGFFSYQKREGLERLLGSKKVPIGELTEVLSQGQWHIDANSSALGAMAPFLEIKNFLGWVSNALEMAERYRGDLGEAQYTKLLQRFQTAARASGMSENFIALLPEAVSDPAEPKPRTIDVTPNSSTRTR
jgi:hypothetical protein